MPERPVSEVQLTEGSNATGTIIVGGTGRVSVQPDVAELRLGIAISRATVKEARGAAAMAMVAVLASIEGAGVARPDFRTTLLSVSPRYDYRDDEVPRLVGYDLANVVEVTVRDLDRLAAVIDGALEAGATSLDGLSFRLDDPREAERTARTSAVAVARARAEVLAAAAGVAITGVVAVSEDAMPPIGPMPKAARMSIAADSATPIEAGTTEIAVSVTVTFRIA
jgi:uncharacterized protein YggE